MNTTKLTQSQEISPASDSDPVRDAPNELHHWLKNRIELSFVYSRSMGGFVQTGRAIVSRMDSEYLEIRTAGTTMIVLTRDAKYSTEPQLFFSPSFTSSRLVPGVSINLENFDWLFLTLAQDKDLVVHGHALPSA